MKKLFCFLVGSFIFLSLKAQDVKGSLAAVTLNLCQSWQLKYGISDSLKIDMSGQGTVLCIFKTDESVLSVSNTNQQIIGNWYYDKKHHIINITKNYNHIMDVISLNGDELIMSVNTENFTSEGPKRIRMVYKLKK